MANLSESNTWEEGIRQLEVTDDALAGSSGVMNTQAKQLANRTSWLKNALTVLSNGLGNAAGKNVGTTDGTVCAGDDPRLAKSSFYDRGDIGIFDFNVGLNPELYPDTLIGDGLWHDLDLSLIVPVNAKTVLIRVQGVTVTWGRLIFRKNGNVNELSASGYSGSNISSGNNGLIDYYSDLIVPMDTNRKIEYLMDYPGAIITVGGWWF